MVRRQAHRWIIETKTKADLVHTFFLSVISSAALALATPTSGAVKPRVMSASTQQLPWDQSLPRPAGKGSEIK